MLQTVISTSKLSGTVPASGLPLLDPKTLDFENGLKVVNRTKRFVVPVPELKDGGEPAVYPAGHEKAGQAIKTKEDGQPERGIVFFNGKDSAWQLARGNGKETILINEVNQEEATALMQKYNELGGRDAITIEGIRALLDFARNNLGLVDFYDKKMADVQKDMAAINPNEPLYMAVTKNTIHSAVYVAEGFTFDGPVPQVYPNGAVVVSSGKYSWGIDTQIFLNNFKAVSTDTGAALERPLRTLKEEFPDASMESYERLTLNNLEESLARNNRSFYLQAYTEAPEKIAALYTAAEKFEQRHPEVKASVVVEHDDRPDPMYFVSVNLKSERLGERIKAGAKALFGLS